MEEANTREINMIWIEPRKPAKETIRLCIGNFVNAPRDKKGWSLESKEFVIQDHTYRLKLYPGGTASSSDGNIAISLTRAYRALYPTGLPLNFSISILNHVDKNATITKVAPPNSKFPTELDVSTQRANSKWEIGWDDFAALSTLVCPKQGFVVLGELIVEAEIQPCNSMEGEFVEARGPELQGATLGQDIQSLWTSKRSSDAHLIVGEKKISIHRSILAARSPVFSSMFSTSMAEANTATVEITDISSEALEVLLEFIYTDSFARQDAGPQLIGDVLKAAKKYDIPRLTSLCEARAITAIDLESVVEWMMLAVMIGAERLKVACMRFVKVHIADVQCTAGWQRLAADKQLASEVMPYILQTLCPPAKRARNE